MQVLAVILGRVGAFISIQELNAFGKVAAVDLSKGLIERYGFTAPKEGEAEKGISFTEGRLGDIAIPKFTFYQAGLEVDTRSSTEDAEKVLNDILSWLVKELGVQYRHQPTERRLVTSQLTIGSDFSLDAFNPILPVVGERLRSAVQRQVHQDIPHETTGITMTFDALSTGEKIHAFRLERRAGAAFSEGKFFAQAPMHTSEHIAVLEDIERALKSSSPRQRRLLVRGR
jgi:hypothetical protein